MADKHPVRTRIISALTVILVVSLTAYFFPGGWAWVFAKAGDAWHWFVGPATVPIWLLVLLCLFALAFFVAVTFLILAARNADQALDFTETELFAIRWRWRYGQHGIFDLVSFCPHCDLQVYAKPTTSSHGGFNAVVYHCDDCNRQLHHFDQDRDEVENLVTRKIQQTIREKVRQRDAAKQK